MRNSSRRFFYPVKLVEREWIMFVAIQTGLAETSQGGYVLIGGVLHCDAPPIWKHRESAIRHDAELPD